MNVPRITLFNSEKFRLLVKNLNRLRFFDAIRILRYGWIVFDFKFYDASSMPKRNKISGYLYFVGAGIWSGRKINQHFEPSAYLKSFPQSTLKSNFPFLHYLAKSSGTNPITSFDLRYLRSNPDLRDFKGPLLFHFMKYKSFKNRHMGNAIEIQNSKYRINVKLPLEKTAFSLPLTDIVLEILYKVKPIISDTDSIQRKKQIRVRTSLKMTEFTKSIDLNLQVNSKVVSNTLNIVIESKNIFLLDVKWLRGLLMSYTSEDDFQISEFENTLQFLLHSVSNRIPVSFELLGDKFAISLDNPVRFQSEPKRHQVIFSDGGFDALKNRTIPGKTILLVSHEDSYTGAPIYLLQLANFLRTQGLEVLVLCIRSKFKSGIFSSQGFKTYYVEDLSTEELLIRNWLLTDLGKTLVTNLLLEIAPSQIWVNSINASCVMELVDRLDSASCLFVHEAFGFMSKDFLVNEYEVMFRTALEKANLVVFGSDYSKSSFYQNEIRSNGIVLNSLRQNDCIIQGFNPEIRISWRNELGIKQDSIVFLSVATFEPRKRIGDIIKAFEHAAPPNSYLILVGYVQNDSHSNRLKKETDGINNIFVFPITKDTSYFYSISDILIFASESETYPLVLQEAVHWDLLRLVAKFPGYSASCNEESALMFEVGNLEQLKSLIAKSSEHLRSTQNLKTSAKLDFSKKEEFYNLKIKSILTNLSLVSVSLEDLE